MPRNKSNKIYACLICRKHYLKKLQSTKLYEKNIPYLAIINFYSENFPQLMHRVNAIPNK